MYIYIQDHLLHQIMDQPGKAFNPCAFREHVSVAIDWIIASTRIPPQLHRSLFSEPFSCSLLGNLTISRSNSQSICVSSTMRRLFRWPDQPQPISKSEYGASVSGGVERAGLRAIRRSMRQATRFFHPISPKPPTQCGRGLLGCGRAHPGLATLIFKRNGGKTVARTGGRVFNPKPVSNRAMPWARIYFSCLWAPVWRLHGRRSG